MQFVDAHGARIPIVGFGSMRLKEEAGAKAIESAIRLGYRHVDTAAFYGNEGEVGQAIRASGVPREEIFLTTKVRDNNLKADDFGWVTRKLMDQADASAGGRVLSVLEGGYDLQGLKESVAAHVTALMGA